MRKIITLLLLLAFVFAQCVPATAMDMASEFLCEVGVRYYKDGRFPDALGELQKALLVNPTNEEARRYILLVQHKMIPQEVLPQIPVAAKKKNVVRKRGGRVVARELFRTEEALATSPVVVVPAPAEARPELSDEEYVRQIAASQSPEAIAPAAVLSERKLAAYQADIKEYLDKIESEKKPAPPQVHSVAQEKEPEEVLVAPSGANFVASDKELQEVMIEPPQVYPVAPEKEAQEKTVASSEEVHPVAMEKEPQEPIYAPSQVAVVPSGADVARSAKPTPGAARPEELTLDDLQAYKSPIEIEAGKSLMIKGQGIDRFLVTEPENLLVERNGSGEILVTGKNFGYTYLHIWQQDVRRTFEFQTVAPKPSGPTIDEEMESADALAKDFKLRYSVDWTSFETGRGMSSLKQLNSTYNHLFYLDGETPYGRLDSTVALNAQKLSTDVTYYTLGLEKGRLWGFKDFSLRVFDFTAGLYNLSFSAGNLRGVRFESPAFNHKFDYLLFWGREGGGRYGGFSPGLAAVKDSYLSGMNLNFKPTNNQSHNVTFFRGWGQERDPNLRFYGSDINGTFHFAPWNFGYDMGYDSHSYAYRLNSSYLNTKLNWFSEIRNIRKDFYSSSGLGANSGELGLLNNILLKPTDKSEVTGRLDIYKDRLFPNPEDPSIWNEDFNAGYTYHFDPLTSWSADYSFQNLLGRASPSRAYTEGIGLYKTWDWFKKISTYVRFNHNINDNFTASSASYKSYRVYSGVRFNVVKNIDYYFNQEYDWIFPTKEVGKAAPFAYENGLDWMSRIGTSPYYGELRLVYRNEENAVSPYSFLSGEDYLEYYGELSYRPNSDFEAYLNTRIRNVWAENPGVAKHLDVDLNAGVRYLWDTGVRWESVGSIEGHVFKDFNGDGLREKEDTPLEGIRIWVGKKAQMTNKAGYYIFKKVRAADVVAAIDSSTIPSGYALTVPATQKILMSQGKKQSVDFGVAIRTEITGCVFEDADGTGLAGPATSGVKDVILTLEDGTKVTTDDYGRFVFKNLSAGKHKATLDLTSVPSVYIPTVPVFKEIELKEGMSYVLNIPLKKIK